MSVSHIITGLFVRSLLILTSSLSLFGCAHERPTETGFIGNYSDLRKTVSDSERIYKIQNLAPPVYQSVIIDPVIVMADAKNSEEFEAYRELSDVLTINLKKEFAKTYQIVDTSSSYTLRVRTAITKVSAANPYVNVPTAFLTGFRFANGGAGIESEVIDSVSQQRLVAMTWADKASFWRPDQIFQSFTYYAQAENLMKVFAERIVKVVAEDTQL
jgi:Protein of unknown function (DUF3313)